MLFRLVPRVLWEPFSGPLDNRHRLSLGLNSLLVRSQGKTILLETGVGDKPGGWRGRSEIRLESRDFEAAARLIGRLQSSMQLLSVSFGVSRQYKVDTENEIIGEALQAFRARAEIVRRALGGQGYVLQRMQIATGGSGPPPRPLARAMATGVAAEAAPPQFEGGMSTITVNVNGTIRIE